MKYRVKSKDLDIEVEANSSREAIKGFFKLLKVFWYEWRNKIGQIGILYTKDTQIPFAMVPSLYNLGLIDEDTALVNILVVLNRSPTPRTLKYAKAILDRMSKRDKWMVE